MRIRRNFFSMLADIQKKEDRRVTVAEVARSIQVPWTTLSEWASNRTTRTDDRLLAKLCTYFDCTPNDLLVLVPDSEGTEEERS